jgi:hypothetical protein
VKLSILIQKLFLINILASLLWWVRIGVIVSSILLRELFSVSMVGNKNSSLLEARRFY